MRPFLLLAAGAAVVLVAAAGFVALREGELPALGDAPAAADVARLERGAQLAAVGNCRGCHTTRGGLPLGGGVAMHSPFGTIYTTNISPDRETGIGTWSEEAFIRAMRRGVARDGRHLYPAFPYERYTRVTDEDDRALYAWLMSQPPVRNVPPRNEVMFPFNIRAGLALWKMAFLEEGPSPPRSGAAASPLARGEYLVEGLGHCGSCHSPRNLAYAERDDRAYAGGDAEGWHAYAIDATNGAPIPWEAKELAFYLRTGFHPRHGVARGPMGLVTAELAEAAPADVEAIAQYAVSLMKAPSEPRRRWADAVTRVPLAPKGRLEAGEGEVIYRTTCASCHDGRRALPFGALPLSWSLGLNGESPRNLINVVVHGLNPAAGTTSPIMPAYAGALSDAQIESLVHWLRANLTDKPAWTGVDKLIRESKAMKPDMLSFPPGGAGADPTSP